MADSGLNPNPSSEETTSAKEQNNSSCSSTSILYPSMENERKENDDISSAASPNKSVCNVDAIEHNENSKQVKDGTQFLSDTGDCSSNLGEMEESKHEVIGVESPNKAFNAFEQNENSKQVKDGTQFLSETGDCSSNLGEMEESKHEVIGVESSNKAFNVLEQNENSKQVKDGTQFLSETGDCSSNLVEMEESKHEVIGVESPNKANTQIPAKINSCLSETEEFQSSLANNLLDTENPVIDSSTNHTVFNTPLEGIDETHSPECKISTLCEPIEYAEETITEKKIINNDYVDNQATAPLADSTCGGLNICAESDNGMEVDSLSVSKTNDRTNNNQENSNQMNDTNNLQSDISPPSTIPACPPEKDICVIDTAGNKYQDLIIDRDDYRVNDDDSDSSEGSSLSISSTSSCSSNSIKSEEQKKKKITRKTYPIKVNGEFPLEDLPRIEELNITVPEGDVQIVGRITGLVEQLVIIESFKNSVPLDDDSVLFLSNGKPIGRVFEIFGPVVQPYYSVRFNSAEEIKEKGIKKDLFVYYAPNHKDITKFVFVDALKKIKGSDASWERDIEPPVECLDYSDDEEEKRGRAKRRAKNRRKNLTGEIAKVTPVKNLHPKKEPVTPTSSSSAYIPAPTRYAGQWHSFSRSKTFSPRNVKNEARSSFSPLGRNSPVDNFPRFSRSPRPPVFQHLQLGDPSTSGLQSPFPTSGAPYNTGVFNNVQFESGPQPLPISRPLQGQRPVVPQFGAPPSFYGVRVPQRSPRYPRVTSTFTNLRFKSDPDPLPTRRQPLLQMPEAMLESFYPPSLPSPQSPNVFWPPSPNVIRPPTPNVFRPPSPNVFRPPSQNVFRPPSPRYPHF